MLTKDPKKRINWKELFEKELAGIECNRILYLFLEMIKVDTLTPPS